MAEPVYQVEVTPYQRPFRQPLHTAHGTWAMREGAIITLRSGSQISQGEIAPLEWFGSERLDTALAFCQGLLGTITASEIFQIPDSLPCCQFAFEMALKDCRNAESKTLATTPPIHQIAALLPTGPAALQAWQHLYNQGHRTFKWKIGVATIEDECQWFHALHQQLPSHCQLRLDANASLTLTEAKRWLTDLADAPIEYLEQPLGIDQFAAMQSLQAHYATPLALDESLTNWQAIQTAYQQGWRGIYVIKPAISGSPHRLSELLQQQAIDVVFSSVFETAVGYAAALDLAQSLQMRDRAFGFGTNDWW